MLWLRLDPSARELLAMNNSVDLPKALKDLIQKEAGSDSMGCVQKNIDLVGQRRRKDLSCYLESVLLTLQDKEHCVSPGKK